MLAQPSALFLCHVPIQDDPNHAKAQPNHAPCVSSPFLHWQITNNNLRDQLAVVESLASLAGILHVKVGAAAYACFCPLDEWY